MTDSWLRLAILLLINIPSCTDDRHIYFYQSFNSWLFQMDSQKIGCRRLATWLDLPATMLNCSASSHCRSECPLHTFGESKIHDVFAGNCRSSQAGIFILPSSSNKGQRLPAIYTFAVQFGLWTLEGRMAKSFLLNTGASIPSVGLGTWQISPAIVEDAIRAAVQVQVLSLLAYV